MRIVVDEKIPYANELFSNIGNVKALPAWKITALELDKIDAVIVRSVTKINKELLSRKSINFVGTVTAGIDHIDFKLLKQMGIGFSAAPGCNSIAVVEYVFSALFMLAERNDFLLKDKIIGIVGVGNIGSNLQKRLKALKINTLLCDPPRANRGDKDNFYTLNELVEYADIITFHTPLFTHGPYKTFHLLDKELIRRLKPNAILINTCRGSVVDNIALLNCLKAGQKLNIVLDVWETEPIINLELLNYADIGTAHIAGYTIEGRVRSTIQVFEAYTQFIGKPQKVILENLLQSPKFSSITLHGSLDQSILKRLIHLVYDVRRDDALLRKIAIIPDKFETLRQNYFERREWLSLNVVCDDIKTEKLLQELGFGVLYQPKY